MKLRELTVLIQNASDKSAKLVLESACPISESYSKSIAYRRYGRSNVDRWLCEGLISINNKKINRRMLEAIAASSNRMTYLPVAER